VRLPHQCHRIEARRFERQHRIVVQRNQTGVPVEMRGFALVAAAALDDKFARLQTAGSDEARAFDFALSTEEQSGETARLRDGRDSIFVAMMLETVCRFADQESMRSEKQLVCELDAR